MQYLIKHKKGKKSRVAHLWDGVDTVCRMASTGGLLLVQYSIHEVNEGLRICCNCLSHPNYKEFVNKGQLTLF